MGYIAAILNKHGDDASVNIQKMLRVASTKPALSYGIANYRNTETSKTTNFTSQNYPLLLGSKNIFPEKYPPEPLQQEAHSLVFQGILLDTKEPDSLSAANTMKKDPEKGIINIIAQRTGAFAVISVTKNSIIAGIDHIGTIPLHFGENRDYIAIATNKKMLWSINVQAIPLQPGQIIKISDKNIGISQIKTLKAPNQTSTTPEKLHRIIKQTTQEYSKNTIQATIAFSGGIDSLLTAYYLQQNNIELELIWAGLENQIEQQTAQEAADYLELRLHLDNIHWSK